MSDERFDRIFRGRYQESSKTEWTSLQVVRRAAQFLGPSGRTRILDVGSGVGKFCLGAAFCTSAQLIGVERRKDLFEESIRVASQFPSVRASFIHGEAMDLDWSFFDSFYFYNPFLENLVGREASLVGISEDRFQRYVHLVQVKLRPLKPGTRVVTFHGLGGELPEEYELLESDSSSQGKLKFWIKREPR